MTRYHHLQSLGVFSSGGDSQGMNAAVRAVVRTALNAGLDIYAIYEGYEGMIRGGDYIRKLGWDDVGGILHQGGTVIGSARSAAFRTFEGRLEAAYNLITRNIDGLVCIGGDGSLTGANMFRQDWPELLRTLVTSGRITQAMADAHPHMGIVGMVGSIDNDMFGTDMTIGADTALHRIVEAVDAIGSTASSHQRSFVVEVMGRHAGYLALMSGLATGADWVFIPESPPEDGWEERMCGIIHAGRARGRRHNIVIVAEGAIDRQGQPIASDTIKQVLTEKLGEDTRVTILGHVQRGGAPSAFDRNMSTMLGVAAVQQILQAGPEGEPSLIGLRDNAVSASPLMENVKKTHQVAELIQAGDYEQAMAMRGRGFVESYEILRTLVQAQPAPLQEGQRRLRLAVMHLGGPAPGMNTAVRAAVRIGLDQGHTMLGVQNGLSGLLAGQVKEMDWMSVHGWVRRGGAELGTSRRLPTEPEWEQIAAILEQQRIDGILMIGGWVGYEFAYELGQIVTNVDKVKESAVASHRVYVVEVMGRDSGYLAMMSGLATGAERVYLPEDGITLAELQRDVADLRAGFEGGKRLGLMIRNEKADPYYTTGFLVTLFEKEGGDLFDVRQTILGHIQQGGSPTPYDRIQATRLATRAQLRLIEQASNGSSQLLGIGRLHGKITFTDLANLPDLVEAGVHRPRVEEWLALKDIARLMAVYAPKA